MRVMLSLAFTSLALVSPVAHAVYKCQVNGTTTYQAQPCSGASEPSQQMDIRTGSPAVTQGSVKPEVPSGAQKSPSSTAGAEKQAVEQMARDRQIREANYEIENLERRIANRSEQITREMDALRAQKARASNNLAGATWEQSLSTEMQAVASRYKVMNDPDQEQIKALRAKVAGLQALRP